MMETQAVDNFPEVPEAIGVLKQLNSDQSFPLFAGINLLGRVDPEHGPYVTCADPTATVWTCLVYQATTMPLV